LEGIEGERGKERGGGERAPTTLFLPTPLSAEIRKIGEEKEGRSKKKRKKGGKEKKRGGKGIRTLEYKHATKLFYPIKLPLGHLSVMGEEEGGK